MQKLKDKRVAVLMTDGFEQSEFTQPYEALQEQGAKVDVVAPHNDHVKAWDNDNWGKQVHVDKTLDEANADDYDALLLPGGVLNPDQLRKDKRAVEFTKQFFAKGKPIAAICHGPQLLIETGAIGGRKLTSYESISTDLKNAGADWVDEEVVVDEGLTTSRNPDDLPAFIDKMIEEFGEGKHEGQKTL